MGGGGTSGFPLDPTCVSTHEGAATCIRVLDLLTLSGVLCQRTDCHCARDLDDIGASDIAVQPLNKLPYGKIDSCKPKFSDGVIFLTYSSLISSSDKVR